MSSDRVRWHKGQRQYIPGEPQLTHNGLPVDQRDWTEEDWRDLHEAIEQAMKRIAARHKKQP